MESPAQKMNAPLAGGRMHRALTIALLVAASVLSGAYAELFHEAVVQARTGIATGMLVGRVSAGSVLSLLAFSLGTFVILCILLNRRVFSAIIRWRFLIAAVVLTVCVACKLSGSSVALWGTVTGGTSFQGTLLGIPREIRSDEWDVMTPFSFSQVQSGFLAQSPILGGGGTDVTMVYGQPAFATATLFRPFLWGYFIFGAERGLSFYWCARLLCMLLVGFSFFRLFSKDDVFSTSFLDTKVDSKTQEHFINVPVNFNYGIEMAPDMTAFIYAGPTLQYGLASKTKVEGTIAGYSGDKDVDNYADGNDYGKMNVLIGGGVGMNLMNAFQITVGYDYGLMNLYTGDADDVKHNKSYIKLGVAYLF